MLVKVWNDNIYENTEKFRGKTISIAPKSFIEMDAGDANLFLGQMKAIEVDHDGNPHPKSYKMLRIEEIKGQTPEPLEAAKFTCMLDGKTFDTQEQLTAHIMANYKDKIFVDSLAEDEIKKKGRPKKLA